MKIRLLLLFFLTTAGSVLPQSADEYYLEAYKAFQAGDVSNQIIYAEKAIELFEIGSIEIDNYFYSFLIASNGYESQQNYEKAIKLLEKVKDKYSGSETKIFAAILHNLAALYKSIGNYLKAKPLYLMAIEIYKKVQGTENAEYVTSLNNLAILYSLLGDYSSAETLYLEVLAISKKIYGTENADFANSLNNLAVFYFSLGNYLKAEPLFLEALEISKKVLNHENPDYAVSLSNLALFYATKGNYSKAEPLYLEALGIVKKVLGLEHPQYATSLNNLAGLYKSMGNYAKAEQLYLETMDIKAKVFGVAHPDYAITINDLAGLYQSMGYYLKAEPLFIEAFNIRKMVFGPEHPDYSVSLNNLALLYATKGNYSKAEPMYLEALAIMKKVFSSEHPQYATSLNNLASLYQNMGNYVKAEPLYLEVIRIFTKILGVESPEYVASLNNLAGLYKSMGNYAKAEQLYLETMDIKAKVFGVAHPDYAITINDLAGLYQSMGYYLKAEPLFIEAFNIRKMVFGPEHPDYSVSLNNLAGLYESKGDYSKVESLYLEAIAIIKKYLGTEHSYYATDLNNLAGFYISMGDYEKSESLYLEAIGILKKVLGPDHPDYATGLNNLAFLYQSLGYYLKAEPLYLEAMSLRMKALGYDHSDYAASLNNLAVLYSLMGYYSKAESLYKESIGITKKVLGLDHPDYCTTLNNLAYLYQSIDNYTLAEPLFLEAMKIREKVLSTDHPNYATSLNNLAVLYQSMGDYVKAYPLLETALSITQKQVRNTFNSLSESEKKFFLKRDDFSDDLFLSVASFIPNVKSISLYDCLLFRKGLILNSSINTRSFITSSNDEKLKQKYSDWLSVKHIINNLYSKTLEQRANSGYNLDSLENYANTIEKDLSKISSTFKDFVMIPDYKWEDVQKNLKHDEAIVDLVKFRFYNKRWTDTTRYGVFITRFDSDDEPVYFELKNGNRIDTLVIPKFNEKNKNRFTDVSTKVEDEKVIILNQDTELDYYSELFELIAQHLKGIKKIYFSLDGEFFKVNFNTIKNPKTNKYLIEDYEIVYVSSANEMARGKTETTPNQTAVLLGFPNYDLSLDSLTAIVKSEQRSDENRDIYVNTSKIKQFNLDMLPGTKDEVIVTTELLKKNGWTVDSWLFNQATESNIKNVNAPGILSISTHGYFSTSPKENYNENFFIGTETKKAVENPLLRSGLFLTGAETFLNSDESQKDKFEENGILTAYEASQLNLFGTDLVILSACETGLGEVNNGEGVFGLQRGFLGAGAKSVLMSLWKVDDSATKDLMIEFMKNYSTTMNKQKSLRDAQLTVMKKYPQPYYWGAFVMVGL